MSINNKITTRGLNLVFGPAAAHFFWQKCHFCQKWYFWTFLARHHRSLLTFFGCRESSHPIPNSPCTYSLAFFLTIIWFLRRLAFCRQVLGGVVQVHRFDNNLVPRPIHPVLVLMQVVARVGQGSQGHGKGWKVGQG